MSTLCDNNAPTLRILDIVEGTSVDGPGLRTAVYLAGCAHHCPGCHNPQSWDFEAGHYMSIDEVMEVIERNDFNVTFSGGDPMYQAEALQQLADRIHALGKNIWCYTGFTLDEISGREPCRGLLERVDVLVDGPFVEALRDVSLHFRGSSNQRIIALHPTPTDITNTFGQPPAFD